LEAAIGQFDCVDVDLIFDIAFEDESVFLRDLEICFEAGVDQISSYPLMRFGYTPFGKSEHHPKKEHQVLRKAEALARQYGYERRSVWAFNRADSPNYTSITREFYLGCGAGAGSFTGHHFYLNHFSISSYIEKVEHGYLPIARATHLSSRKAAFYYLFWQVYTGKINISHFEALYPGQQMLKGLLSSLRKIGILQYHDGHLILTQQGYDKYHDLERWVTYRFIEPLWADMMREHAYLRDHLSPPSTFQRFWLRLAGLNN
jgi:coproporphyrinogen III oxidase-like Fe-S oxidoreductase